MPRIAAAMRRSTRESLSRTLLNSIQGKRDIGGDIDGVKSTFSSWDNCMAKAYCKWPVIIGIIIASLVLISILWCIIRCACCGMSCCCTCLSFLKCCDCCGGCCDGKRDRPMKHLDDNFTPQPGGQNRGYRSPAPMMAGALGGRSQPARYAQFEVGKNGLAVEPNSVSEDALPPMPSWNTATKKHVLSEENNAVEMGDLDPNTGQQMPLVTGAVRPGLASPGFPESPYGASPTAPSRPQPGSYFDRTGYETETAFDHSRLRSPSPAMGRGRGEAQLGRGGRGRGINRYGPEMGRQGREVAGRGRNYGSEFPTESPGRFPSPISPIQSPEEDYAGYSNTQPAQFNQGYHQMSTSNFRDGTSDPPHMSRYRGDQFESEPGEYQNQSQQPRSPTFNYGTQTYPPPSSNPMYNADPARAFHHSQSTQDDFQRHELPSHEPTRYPDPVVRSPPPPRQHSDSFTPAFELESPLPQDTPYGRGSTAPPSYVTNVPSPQELPTPGYRTYQGNGRGNPQAPRTYDPMYSHDNGQRY